MLKSVSTLLAFTALSSLSGCKIGSSSVSDELTIASIDGLTLPDYTVSNGVYTFPLSGSVKEGVRLSGTLSNGSIVIDPGTLSDNKSFEIDLSGVSITSSSDYPIYYGSKASKLIINALAGTTNSLTYNGTVEKGAALFSENNLDIEGSGSLALTTTKDGHGFRGDDLTLSGTTQINISAIHDGIHGKTLTSSAFTGAVAIASCGSEAFDICDNDSTTGVCSGSVKFGASTGSYTVGKCNDVFEVDNSFTIPSGVSITAENCASAAVTNLNAASVDVTIEGTFKVNGVALSSYSVATKAS